MHPETHPDADSNQRSAGESASVYSSRRLRRSEYRNCGLHRHQQRGRDDDPVYLQHYRRKRHSRGYRDDQPAIWAEYHHYSYRTFHLLCIFIAGRCLIIFTCGYVHLCDLSSTAAASAS